MFDELRGLDVDVSCENVEIAVFSEAENFTRALVVLVYPLQTCRELVCNQCMDALCVVYWLQNYVILGVIAINC